jgi:hypothetical protein
MARVAVSAASRKKSLLVVMRGNREFSGVVDIILASVRHEVHSGQADELQILSENVSEILPGPPREHLLPVPFGSTEAHFFSRRKFQWHSVSDLRRFRQLRIEIAYDRIA